MVEIVREQTLFIQSAPFVELLITVEKNVSKYIYMKREKLVRLVLQTIDEQNGHLENILDVDLKTT